MKKAFVTLIFAGLLAAAMIVPAAAAESNEILYGTPKLDGVLDEMYNHSASHVVDNFAFYIEGSTTAETTAEGTTAYLLWDEKYLYIATNANDATRSDKSADIDYSAWHLADNTEHFLFAVYDDVTEWIHVATVGEGLCAEVNWEAIDPSAIKVATSSPDTGYVVELAIPVPASIAELKAGSEIAYCLQYNDYIPADSAAIANGNQSFDGATTYVLSTTAAPVEEAPVVEEVVETTVTQAPQTFDAGVIAVITAIVSAAGYALSKKR